MARLGQDGQDTADCNHLRRSLLTPETNPSIHLQSPINLLGIILVFHIPLKFSTPSNMY